MPSMTNKEGLSTNSPFQNRGSSLLRQPRQHQEQGALDLHCPAATLDNPLKGLSRREKEDLQDAFQLLDTDRQGKVSLKELCSLLQELTNDNLTINQREGENDPYERSRLKHLHRALEKTQALLKQPHQQAKSSETKQDDRELTFQEFCQLLIDDEDVDDVQQLFELFDRNGKGYIEMDDLRCVAEELGESMDESELQEMMERLQPLEPGKVSLSEFESMLNRKLFTL